MAFPKQIVNLDLYLLSWRSLNVQIAVEKPWKPYSDVEIATGMAEREFPLALLWPGNHGTRERLPFVRGLNVRH